MRHPTEGVLRRLLDEPSGVSVVDRQHVHQCGSCLAELDVMAADAALVGACLSDEGSQALDVDAAWRRLDAAPAATVVTALARRPDRRARRSVLRHPAVAAAAVAVALTGAGTAAANDWLPIFRAEQVEPLDISPGDLVALPDLSAYGELTVQGEPDVRTVPDEAAARSQTGLDVPAVSDLPRGVEGEPEYTVGDQVSATFTFSAARAAAAVGDDLPPLPEGLDGSAVRLDAGPGVAQVWPSSSGAPALLVGRAVAPKAFSSGAPFETVRDYLLSLPGLPDEIADQLGTFTADGSTLPLPVPADEVTTRSTEVDGAPATVLTTRDQALAAVVWVEDGRVTVVAGSLDDSEVLDVARDLR